MNPGPKSHLPKQLLWPVAGVVAGFLVTSIASPSGIPVSAGVVTWCAAMVIIPLLSVHPFGARVASFAAGSLLPVPCVVSGTPLVRFLLMCLMAFPLVLATAMLLGPPVGGFRVRLGHLFTWRGTQQIKRRARTFDAASLLQLIIATVVLGAALAAVKSAPDLGFWRLPVRWLAGGIAILAFAEIGTAAFPLAGGIFGVTVPPLMRSPYLSASLGEFWAKRWNIFTSQMVFRPFCFGPLARRSIALAVIITFAASALTHLLLAYMALGQWPVALLWAAFFLVQPILIAAERCLHVRRWPRPVARAWTLTALTITSPLFVEPAFQIIGKSWEAWDNVWPATLAVLGFVVIATLFVTLASLATSPPDKEPIAVA